MNSKTKGNIGEAIALAEFVSYGIQVSLPFWDNARYDMIAEFNGKLNKIQVKYCNRISKNNSVICPICSSTNHTKIKGHHNYKNDVDYIVIVIPRWNKVLLIPIEVCGDNISLSFRIDEPKTKNQNEIHYCDNYSFDKTLNGITI